MTQPQTPVAAIRARDRAVLALREAADALTENKYTEAGSLIAEALRSLARVSRLVESATEEMRQRNEQFRRDFPQIFAGEG